MIAARGFEVGGTSAACFAIAASVAIGLGRPDATVPLLAVAMIITAVRVVRRRPSLATAASLSDRRFGWDDLLASALATGTDPDPFAAAVRASADARCRAVRPSDVRVARRGRRGWIAIAVAASLPLVTIGLHGRATPLGPDSADQTDATALVADAQPPTAAAAVATTSTLSPRRTGEDEVTSRSSPHSTDETATSAEASTTPRHADANPASAATGRGAASTPRPLVTDLPPDPAAVAHADTGTAAAGGGRAAAPPAQGADASQGTTAAARGSLVIPPWTSPDWPAARRKADAAVTAGTVPPRDRDLVRAYFDRAAEFR